MQESSSSVQQIPNRSRKDIAIRWLGYFSRGFDEIEKPPFCFDSRKGCLKAGIVDKSKSVIIDTGDRFELAKNFSRDEFFRG